MHCPRLQYAASQSGRPYHDEGGHHENRLNGNQRADQQTRVGEREDAESEIQRRRMPVLARRSARSRVGRPKKAQSDP